jgi:hypothetical protein
LAERIAFNEAAEARIAALRGATGYEVMRDARARRDAAQAALADALQADDAAHVDAIMTKASAPPATAPAARAEALAAEAEVAAAERALAVLRADLEALERGRDLRGLHLRSAVADVVRAETSAAVETLVSDLEAAMRRVLDTGRALAAVLDAHGHDPSGALQRSAARRLVARLDGRPGDWGLDGADQPTLARWRSALAALKDDADAPLPGISP